MKAINHDHQKPSTSKFTLKKIILYWFLFTTGSTVVFFLFSRLPWWLQPLIFLFAVGYGGYYIYRKMKGKAGYRSSVPSSPAPERMDFELNGSVTIVNPYAGVFVCGGAGSGKSKSIVEPVIYDAGRKNFSGVVYDFKYPELARYVESAYQNSPVKRYYINFSDLSTSNRVNPIAPEVMRNVSFAREFAHSVLANLNPQMISKPDFWSDNSLSLLSAVFWYLRQEKPEYCTLPHAISLVLQPDIEALLKMLQTNLQCADMVAPIAVAMQTGAQNQLAGVVSSLQVSLSKINTPEIYYITSRSDFSLNLNDPMNPGILTIGNDPVLSSTYAPVIGLMLTAITKQLNQQGKQKSMVLLDEFPTVFVPNIEQLPATARSNKVATVLACQDITQIVDKYGKEKAEAILSNLGNQFYGRTTNPQTAQRVSQMFGKSDKMMKTDSRNFEHSLIGDLKNGRGESYSYQERELVKVQDVATIETGSFYAILSEGSVRQGKTSIALNNAFIQADLPQRGHISDDQLTDVFNTVKMESNRILLENN
jgi:type IV secretory pathway TraG/TraD family ATPase VirD4